MELEPCPSTTGRPSPPPTTIRICGWRTSRASARSQFVERQNRLTLRRFGGPAFAADRDTLAAIYDRPDNIPYVTRRGGLLYNLWRDAEQSARPLAAHHAGRVSQSRAGMGDRARPRPLAAEEGEDWLLDRTQTLLPGSACPRDPEPSRGGGDAVVLREFDIGDEDLRRRWLRAAGSQGRRATGSMPTRCCCPAPMARAWRPRPAMPARCGCGGAARTPLAGAGDLRDQPRTTWRSASSVDRTAPARRVWFVERLDFFHSADLARRRSRRSDRNSICRPMPGLEAIATGWSCRPRTAWTIGGHTLRAGHRARHRRCRPSWRASAISRSLFEPATAARAAGLFLDRRADWSLSMLDESAAGFRDRDAAEAGWTQRRLARTARRSASSTSGGSMPTRPKATATLLANIQDPLTPPTLMLIEAIRQPDAVLKQAPRTFSTPAGSWSRATRPSRSMASASPMCRSARPAKPAMRRCICTRYGGFGLAMLPYLQFGARQAVAGARRHQRGRQHPRRRRVRHALARRRPPCAGKRLAHDDFAAVAADLVRRGVTRPGRIAAEGGSNGGILITNMLTRYPERFGALFCTIPLIDMRRYTQAAGRRELDRRIRRSRQAGGVGLAADLFGLSHRRARRRAIRRSCSPPRGGTTASIPATPARWRPSCRRWATRPGSTSPPPAATATARTTASAPLHRARLSLS